MILILCLQLCDREKGTEGDADRKGQRENMEYVYKEKEEGEGKKREGSH